MKIHIVQKGDTLWKIAKKYGVNFEELKKMNSQLSNPDMIMPGMKIKVPSTGIQVKKEVPMGHLPIKEAPIAVHPYAEMPPIPLPVVEEVKEKPFVPVKEMPLPVMPKPTYVPMPQIYHPQQEIDVNNYYMLNMAMTNQPPQLPPKPANVLPGIMKPEEESPEVVESPEQPPVYQQPMLPPQPVYQQPYIPCMAPCPPPPCCVPVTPVMPGAGFYPVQPYPYAAAYPAGNPGMMNPAMMPNTPFMPGIENPDDLESMPESIDFNFPINQGVGQQMATPYGFQEAGFNPQGGGPYGNPGVGMNPQMAGPYGYQREEADQETANSEFQPDVEDRQLNAQFGYPGAQAMPNYCVPITPVLPGSGFGYQPFYGTPQMGYQQGNQFPGGGFGAGPEAFGQPSQVPGYGQTAPQLPYGVPQTYQQPFQGYATQAGVGNPMYPYGYPRQYNPYFADNNYHDF